MVETTPSSNRASGERHGDRFKRAGRVGLLAYAAGFVAHGLYFAVIDGLAGTIRLWTAAPVWYVETAVRSYEASHFGGVIAGTGSTIGFSIWRFQMDPVPYFVPVAVLVVAGWHLANTQTSRESRRGQYRLIGGLALGYLAVVTIASVAVGRGVVAPVAFGWKALVVGVVYPVVCGGIGVWLHEHSGQPAGTTEPSGTPGDDHPLESGGEAPAAADLTCGACGRRAGRGSFCPHCGADL